MLGGDRRRTDTEGGVCRSGDCISVGEVHWNTETIAVLGREDILLLLRIPSSVNRCGCVCVDIVLAKTRIELHWCESGLTTENT